MNDELKQSAHEMVDIIFDESAPDGDVAAAIATLRELIASHCGPSVDIEERDN